MCGRQRTFPEQRSAHEGSDGCRGALRGSGLPRQQPQPGRLRHDVARLPDDDQVPAEGLLAGRRTRTARASGRRCQAETEDQVTVAAATGRVYKGATG